MDAAYKIYYLRDEKKAPFITVCIGKNTQGGWHRGISICSKKDHVTKKTGRDLAYLRMLEANFFSKSKTVRTPKRVLRNKAVTEYITSNFEYDDMGYVYISASDVVLSKQEKEMFRAPPRRAKPRRVSKAKKSKIREE